MNDAVNGIVAELEAQTPISESALKDLQILLDSSLNSSDSVDIEALYAELSSRNLSISCLVDSLSSAMDNGTDGLTPFNCTVSVLASNVYLSLLLSPNSPVFTLFTPMALLSLLRSIRRAVKRASGSSWESSVSQNRGRKKRGGGRNSRGENKSKFKGKNVEDSGKEGEEENFDARRLFCVLERVEMVLGLVRLDRFPDSLRSLVQTMVEIPATANEVCGNGEIYAKISALCLRILGEVLKAEHGDQGVTAAEILKSMTPLLLLPKSELWGFASGFVLNQMMEMSKESREIKNAILNLPKYIVHKAPEKAELRALAVESIATLFKSLDFEDQVKFADYVVKMTHGKGQFRLLAVDLVPVIMMSSRDPLGLDLGENVEHAWGLRCLEAVIQRCSDATAGVRARALTNLAQLVGLLSADERSKEVIKELLGFGNKGSNKVQGATHNLLRTRCRDEKAAVRKASLLMISKLIAAFGGALDGDLLKTVGMACSDPLVSIRKAAISALSEAFRTSCDDSVTKEWLHSVPRLISDNESGIQEECENLFLELVIDRVAKGGLSSSYSDDLGQKYSKMKEKMSDGDIPSLDPDVLCILKEICHGEVTPWLKKICSSLGKKKKLKSQIAISLQNIIRTSELLWRTQSMPTEMWMAPPGAWLLLSEVSAFLSKAVDWNFLHHHWTLLDKDKDAVEFKSSAEERMLDDEVMDVESSSVAWIGDRVFLLQTINNIAVELPPEPAADLAHNLLKRIEKFNMHSTEVNAHVKALKTLCRLKSSNPKEADSLVNKWVHQILSKASRIVDMYMSSKDAEGNKNRTIFTPPNSHANGIRTATSMTKLLQEAITAVYTIGSLIIIYPSADLRAINPMLHTIITSGRSDPKRNLLPITVASLKQTAPSLYIHAWLTMGKICLADGKLAKRYIPLFVQELESSDCVELRNNIVVMMADFCVRYTALVDCYMPRVTKCLRDPCELVRRQTFILLARLLQRDYVKWRGVLFLRFLLSLVDDSEKIRQLADFLFGNILKVKAPLLAYNSFVEAIYVLNDCNAHTGRSNPQRQKSENSLFSLRGVDETSKSRRMHIYVTLLKQMAPEHHLATFAKVCAEILAAASDGMLDLEDATGQSVLQDAFQVLSSKEIRIPSSRTSSDAADVDEDGVDGGSASASFAKGRTITQAVRKGLIQNTVPIFIELKRLVESKNSPLTGSLMECMRILLKDYKNEIDEILIADKQLQKELIYDMQKYEATHAKTAAAEAVATMQRAEAYFSPGVPKHMRSGPSKQYFSPGVPKHMRSGPSKQVRFPDELPTNAKVASAVADAVATARARSVLREVNAGTPTPPLSAMNAPKLKSKSCSVDNRVQKSADVLASLRRRHTFDSDDEN